MNFWVGQTFTHDQLQFRVVQGSKKPDDLRLDLRNTGGYVAVPMALGFILADFFFQNEERLYPRCEGKKGGDKYLSECRRAARHGWEKAQSWLEFEQGELW